jgi:hypothetical protein
MGPEEEVRDDQPEHSVAEKLESLVGGPARVFSTPRPVAEGLNEEYPVRNFPTQLLGQRLLQGGALGWHPSESDPAGGTARDGQLASSFAIT